MAQTSHSLVAQEEQSLEETVEDTTKEPSWHGSIGNVRLCASAVALLGLLSLGLATVGISRAASCTELLVPNRRSLAWAGRLKGPVERKLNADSVGDAIAILERATQVAREVQQEVLRIKTALDLEAPRVNRKKRRKRATARCVLNTITVTENIARIGTNLKASAAVCAEDPLFQLLPGKFGRLVRSLKTWICAINIDLVIIGFFSIATNLAQATVQCSVASNSSSGLNAAQQVEASCTAAGLTLVQSLVTLSATLQITIPGCEILSRGIEQQLKAGLASLGGTPSTFGQLSLNGKNVSGSQRRQILQKLEDSLTPDNFGSGPSLPDLIDPGKLSESTAASQRRLFLGGGPGAFVTMCVVDVLQALTTLGLMGVELDSIIHADCRDLRLGPVTSKALPKPLRDRVENGRKAGCASGVSNVLAKIGISVLYLSFTSFHCTNEANVRAICGAGIAGIEASLAGVATAGAGAYLACTEGKRKKQTEYLIQKSLAKFVKEASEEVLEEVCPDLSLDCFVGFTKFFEDCPEGVTATCPSTPSARSCPGVESCAAEFNLYRAANLRSPWFPKPQSNLGQFVKLVEAIPACWEYLNCFAPKASPRRLTEVQSEARRSLLLQKVFASAWSATSVQQVHPKEGVPGNATGMELVEQLFATLGQRPSATDGSGMSLMDAKHVGEQILDEVSLHWQQQKASMATAQCHAMDPLLEEPNFRSSP